MGIRVSLGIALLFPGLAVAAGPTTLEELEDCARGNRPLDSSVQQVLLRSRDRVERISESRASIYWKRFDNGLSRVLLRMSDPPAQRGAGVLLIEQKNSRADIFMYLPELGRVRRVTTRMVAGSLFGTDFSYEDFERVQGYAQDQSSELLAEKELDGRPVLVVESHLAPESGSAYERSVSYFDPETCVPLEVRLYERGEEPRKVLRADASRIEAHGERHLPRLLVMEDLRDGTSTEMVVEELELDAPIKRKMFSERELQAGGR